MKQFSFLLLVFLLNCLQMQARGLEEKEFRVNPKQITITENGIFAYLDGESNPIEGKSLSFDKHGNLVLKDIVLNKGPCYIHNLWCRRCGGCGVLLCPMNCSCFD